MTLTGSAADAAQRLDERPRPCVVLGRVTTHLGPLHVLRAVSLSMRRADAAALASGTLLAVMPISPAAPARAARLAYAEWFCTPVTLMLVALLCLPTLGFGLSDVESALLVLSTYTATEVGEALCSGVNAVPKGQAEAAGTLGPNLRQMALPPATPSPGPNAGR